ncbi:hypothetical protein CEK25_005976 [Fusarium fujikuroi]|nr:hypothetical protein CEK25_005976 [Fusarium fujikuroi]
MEPKDTGVLGDSKFLNMEPWRPSMMPARPQHGTSPITMHIDTTSERHDSSPTTTLSTTDSSPASPSSSPDSPPLNNYPATSSATSPTNLIHSHHYSASSCSDQSITLTRRGRNTLSIQPPSLPRPTTFRWSPRGLLLQGISIKPTFLAMRRKPSQLLVSRPTSP